MLFPGYFAAIVKAANMTRAAEQLHVTQTPLGMQIRQLAEDLGVALLTRHSRGVEPTQAGKLLHSRALAILKLTDETEWTLRLASARAASQSASGLRLP